MNSDDHAKHASEYLEDLCERLDRGEPLARGNWVSKGFLLIVPVVLGLAACGCGSDEDGGSGGAGGGGGSGGYGNFGGDQPMYAAPSEICDNGIDDNGDGKVDCDDPQCETFSGCAEGALYAGPPDEICDNGIEDNGDGNVDCDDPQCMGDPTCPGIAYAGPPEICDNEIDDNGDGKVDCDDPQCETFPGCGPGTLYAGPPEICDNEIDDNGDGKIDCDDPQCETFPGCNTVPYAAP